MKTAASTLLLLALAATPALAQHSVSVTWTASTDSANNPSLAYNIYRSSVCTGTFARLNTSPVAATNYLDTAVLPGSYCYQITSVLNGTEGAPSNQAAVLIPAPSLQERSGCQHRGSLLTWLRCVGAIAHSQPQKGKRAP